MVKSGGLLAQAKSFAKTQPFATNIMVATTKTAVADVLVQKAEGRKEIDWRRTGIFASFGFFCLGGVQYLVCVEGFKRLFPAAARFAGSSWKQKLVDGAGQRALLGQAFVDNCIWGPFGYFPIFYMFKESIQGGSEFEVSVDRMKSGLRKWKENFWPDAKAMACVYVPLDLFIFAAPMWMRMPLTHASSFGWTLILSSMRGGGGEGVGEGGG
jgi:hypothetical protein